MKSAIHRDAIIGHFDKIDTKISSLLRKHKSDLSFPFSTAHNLSNNGDVDPETIFKFLITSKFFHKYREPISEKSNLDVPSRSTHFITNTILENKVEEVVERFLISQYIAEKITNELILDYDLNWFIKQHQEFIIIDAMNVYHKIKEYSGQNKFLKKIKNGISSIDMNDGLDLLMDFMSSNMNNNSHGLIFITPFTKTYTEHYLSDSFFVVVVDCKKFHIQNCSSEASSNETDDCVLLYLYDWMHFKKNYSISILSGDNYDFSIISHDFFKPYDRAIISDENEATILSWSDITYENPIFSFENSKLTIFEEEIDSSSIKNWNPR